MSIIEPIIKTPQIRIIIRQGMTSSRCIFSDLIACPSIDTCFTVLEKVMNNATEEIANMNLKRFSISTEDNGASDQYYDIYDKRTLAELGYNSTTTLWIFNYGEV